MIGSYYFDCLLCILQFGAAFGKPHHFIAASGYE
jgi:hypothetical protein